jgi:hypothetical protein
MLLAMTATKVKDEVIALGGDEETADRVAEAAARRAQAQSEGKPFIYIDVVFELEDLYRAAGVSEENIEHTKSEVWTAAREISAELGYPIEECLFFCFHQAADVYRESHPSDAS